MEECKTGVFLDVDSMERFCSHCQNLWTDKRRLFARPPCSLGVTGQHANFHAGMCLEPWDSCIILVEPTVGASISPHPPLLFPVEDLKSLLLEQLRTASCRWLQALICSCVIFRLGPRGIPQPTSWRVHTRLVPTLLMAMLQPQLLSFLFLLIISLPQRPMCYLQQGIGRYGL